MQKIHKRKDLKRLAEFIRESLSPEPVCDSVFKCKDWEECMDQIIAAQLFCANYSCAPKYTGKPFKYCPWCGCEIK